jgi:hypothetical protein
MEMIRNNRILNDFAPYLSIHTYGHSFGGGTAYPSGAPGFTAQFLVGFMLLDL